MSEDCLDSRDLVDKIVEVGDIIQAEELPDKAWMVLTASQIKDLVDEDIYTRLSLVDVGDKFTVRCFTYEKIVVGMLVMVRATYNKDMDNEGQ